MKKTLLFLCAIIFIAPIATYCDISMVYNLRIAETTKRQSTEEFNKFSTPVFTLFEQWRKKGTDTYEFIGGGLASYIALFRPFYARVDWAVAHVNEKTTDTFFARTQTDDLLFSAGYDLPLSSLTRFTFSGLLGIPTHQDTALQGIQFGYAHVGLGMQVDGAFTFAHHTNQSIRSAVRYIRFVPRQTVDCVQNQPQSYLFNLGNLMDLFIAWHSKVHHSRWEFGYNPSFLFGAKITPDDQSFIQANNYIKNSFYANYKHLFSINGVSNAIQALISYGFDARPKVVGHSRIVNIWASWIINF